MSVGITSTTSLLPPQTRVGNRKPFLSSTGALSQRLPPINFPPILPSTGLTTSSFDDMSTAYQPALTAYDGHSLQHAYHPSVPSAGRTRSAMADGMQSQQYYRYPTEQGQLHPQQHLHMTNQVQQPPLPSQSYQTQPQLQDISSTNVPVMSAPNPVGSPVPSCDKTTMLSHRGAVGGGAAEGLIFHSLQIPLCISPQGGNLADFAAQMTCLFWFDSTENLKQAGSFGLKLQDVATQPLPALARPLEQFRKWVYNVLSTTQVTQNVMLLALLFIYRLKMSTPQIKGRAGSEYRLLTVALMLANKFLDDNTYTNKTWAEVSCFSVQEIHVMEVEFLSNMRYNLLASKSEWDQWLLKLANFYQYYDRALNMPSSPTAIPSPNNRQFSSPLASPTAAILPRHGEFPFPSTPSGTTQFSPSTSQSQNWAAYQSNAVSPLAARPALSVDASRKRSPEDDLGEHPAKRQAPPRLAQVPAGGMTSRPNGPAEAARLPCPQLTLMTNTPANSSAAVPQQNHLQHTAPPQLPSQMRPTHPHHPQPQSQQQQLTHYPTPGPLLANSNGPPQSVSLPPLQPGVRAMSTVYQPAPGNLMQHAAPPTSVGATSIPATAFPSAAMAPMSFGTPVKLQSPGNLAPFASSPMGEFGTGSAVHTPMSHTPISNSPSVYLQQRASPYKPIRNVRTLLYPPPSASLDQYHLAVPVQPAQMHYQPIGRRNDVRTGVVPEFVVHHQNRPPQGHYPS